MSGTGSTATCNASTSTNGLSVSALGQPVSAQGQPGSTTGLSVSALGQTVAPNQPVSAQGQPGSASGLSVSALGQPVLAPTASGSGPSLLAAVTNPLTAGPAGSPIGTLPLTGAGDLLPLLLAGCALLAIGAAARRLAM